jgi:hypothetical protein
MPVKNKEIKKEGILNPHIISSGEEFQDKVLFGAKIDTTII